MTQPNNVDLLIKYWNDIGSPLKDKILFFFKSQGSKRANNDSLVLRTAWAEVVSRIPGLVYKKKTTDCLEVNNIELKAGWINYLKAIAYLKNNRYVWDELCELSISLTKEKKLSTRAKAIICRNFSELAGIKLQSIEWVESDKSEGIRDMEEFGLDILGKIRVLFFNVSEPIDFVMQDGHGFVQWSTINTSKYS